MSESGEHNQLASLASSTAATWPYGLLPNSFIFLTTPLGLQIDTPIQGIISTVLFGPGALPARSSTTTSAIIISCTCCRTRVSHSLSLHTWLTHTITRGSSTSCSQVMSVGKKPTSCGNLHPPRRNRCLDTRRSRQRHACPAQVLTLGKLVSSLEKILDLI